MSSTKVGFIGLGRMGRGMAANLLKGGVDLHVFDSLAPAVEALSASGATACSSVGELTRAVDVLFTSLPGPTQVREVVYGEDGVLANIRSGQVLFELSTSSRALALELHRDFGAKDAHVLDAPVSGGPAGAASGDMAFWVGGDKEIYDRYVPLLKMMGDKPLYVGDIGSGTVVKLVNNMTGITIMSVLGETFSLAVKAGLDPLDLWEALRLGVVGKSSPLDMLRNQFLPGRYETPAFALRLAYKDVFLATELGRDLGVPMRHSTTTMADMMEALEKGMGDHDRASFLKLQLERAGVEIAVDQNRLSAAFKALESQTSTATAPPGTQT
jgi:3-hydroxyisobutyrate dehydrogenase